MLYIVFCKCVGLVGLYKYKYFRRQSTANTYQLYLIGPCIRENVIFFLILFSIKDFLTHSATQVLVNKYILMSHANIYLYTT